MTIQVLVIGIGSGRPEHLTGEAVAALNSVDVFLVADKGTSKHDLVALRTELCAAVIEHDRYRVVEVPDPEREAIGGYEAGVRDWHAARAAAYAEVIRTALPAGGTVGFLAWGDPALYDSTIRIVESVAALGVELELTVVPGISSVQLLAAAHRIVLNRVGQPVHLTTGRRLVEEYSPALGDVVVMLDGDLACTGLVDRHPDLTIYWGAQLGLPDEALVSGRLAEVIGEIRTRARHPRAARLGDGHLPAQARSLVGSESSANGSSTPIRSSRASGPCRCGRLIASRYPGSKKSTARRVSAVRRSSRPASAWANRMNARSTAGIRNKSSGSATILRGYQSSSRISTAAPLQRSGSP